MKWLTLWNPRQPERLLTNQAADPTSHTSARGWWLAIHRRLARSRNEPRLRSKTSHKRPTANSSNTATATGCRGLGSSTTRDSEGGCRQRFVYERRRASQRVPVRREPADPPARGRAERATLPAHWSKNPYHAGGIDAAQPQQSAVRRHPRDARGHSREPAHAQRLPSTRRGDDRVLVRVSAASEGVPTGAPWCGGQGERWRDAANPPPASQRRG